MFSGRCVPHPPSRWVAVQRGSRPPGLTSTRVATRRGSDQGRVAEEKVLKRRSFCPELRASRCRRRLRRQSVPGRTAVPGPTAVLGQTEDMAQPEPVAPIRTQWRATGAVGARQDFGLGPMFADLPDEAATMCRTFALLGAAGRAHHRPAEDDPPRRRRPSPSKTTTGLNHTHRKTH